MSVLMGVVGSLLRSLRFLYFWRHPENICGRRVWSEQ